MKKYFKRFLSLILALSLMPTIGFAASQNGFEKGDPNTYWGVLYSPGDSDETFVKSVNITTEMFEAKGAKNLAKEVSSSLKLMPEGRRVIDLTNFTYLLGNKKKNYFFLNDDYVQLMKKNADDFFRELKALDAPLDYVIDDNEDGIVCYAIENAAIKNFKGSSETTTQTIQTKGHLYEEWIKEQLIAIEKLPEYQKVRPMLEEAGYVFGEEYDLEYINIFPGAQEPRRSVFYSKERPEGADTTHTIFNEVMDQGIFLTAYREAVYEQAIKYYPDILFSNYGDSVDTGKLPIYNYNGTKSHQSGKTNTFLPGNATAMVRYGNFKDIEQNPPAEYPWETMPNTAFNQLLLAMFATNNNTIASNNEIPYMVWVGMKTWTPGGQGGYQNFHNTDYYEEAMFHFGLCNPNPYLIYNQDSQSQGDDLNILRSVFRQLGELVGFDDRKVIIPTLNQAVSWDQRYIVSGMSANGKGIFRVTPDLYTPGVSMENFLVSTLDGVTFRIGNQYVKFPEGSYIYEPEEKVSEYGYWVITEEPVWPEEWRTIDDYLPDMPVATDDLLPAGEDMEPTETLPDPDNYLKPIIEEDSQSDLPLTPSEGGKDETDTPSVSKPTATTLKLNPIKGDGYKITIVDGGMPRDMVGHWAQHSLANMMGLGILKGSDVGMEPDRMITKAEFLTMLTRILGVKTSAYEGGYSDVAQDAWYADVMSTVARGGWIEDEGGNLHPEVDLTRGKLCTILIKALGITESAPDAGFSDTYYLGRETKNAINTAAHLGLIEGYPDGSFGANNICTRAEMATIFERLLLVIPDLFE